MFDGQFNGASGEPIDHFLGPTPTDGMPTLMSEFVREKGGHCTRVIDV